MDGLCASLAALMTFEFLRVGHASELAYGLALGYVLGVTIHVVHLAMAEMHPKSSLQAQ